MAYLVNSKLEMVKAISSHTTVNAILINTAINSPKLALMREYKLATTGQKFMKTYLA